MVLSPSTEGSVDGPFRSLTPAVAEPAAWKQVKVDLDPRVALRLKAYMKAKGKRHRADALRDLIVAGLDHFNF